MGSIIVVSIIGKNLEDKNVLIHRNSQLIEMKIVDNKVHYLLEYNDGNKELFIVDKALISV